MLLTCPQAQRLQLRRHSDDWAKGVDASGMHAAQAPGWVLCALVASRATVHVDLEVRSKQPNEPTM